MVDIAKKCGYSASFISQLMSGYSKFNDKTAKKILIQGIGLSPAEAEKKLAGWWIEYWSPKLGKEEKELTKIVATGMLTKIPPKTGELIPFPLPLDKKGEDYYIYTGNDILGQRGVVNALIRFTSKYEGVKKPHLYSVDGHLEIGKIAKTDTHWEVPNYPPIPVSSGSFSIHGVIDTIVVQT